MNTTGRRQWGVMILYSVLLLAMAVVLSQFTAGVYLYVIYGPTQNELIAWKHMAIGNTLVAWCVSVLIFVMGCMSQFSRLRLR